MKDHILILDDEPIIGEYLKECIEEYKNQGGFFQRFSVTAASKLSDFWAYINEHKPSMIFLDIEMPGQNGIEVAARLKQNYKHLGYEEQPIIIFCTAYENYGYQAFTVDALDYLLKPVNQEQICAVFNKALTQHKDMLSELYNSIEINLNGLNIKVPVEEILYFKADMKYITVVTQKKEFLINDTLLNLERTYQGFLKTHRSYLVNSAYIRKFYKKDNHWYLSLLHVEKPLPVSRRQKQELQLKIAYNDFFN